jgi:hypothetical protein
MTEWRATQVQRLLSWALAGHALHQDPWYFEPTPDLGPAIKALRSRIPELEAAGYGFDHRMRPDGTIEYRLAYVPERMPAPEPELSGADELEELTEPMFDAEHLEPPAPSSTSTRPGFYDWDGEDD